MFDDTSAVAVLVAVIAALFTGGLFALLAYSAHVLIIHRRYSHIPTPKGASFFIGHVAVISKEGILFDILLEWYKRNGPLFILWLFHYPIVVAIDAESVKKLMSRNVSKPVISTMHFFMGQRVVINSLPLIPNYEEWKDRRRTFDNAFTRKFLRSLVPHFNVVAKDHLLHSILLKASKGGVVMMKREFSEATLEAISTVAFGNVFSKNTYVQKLVGKNGLLGLIPTMMDGFDKVAKNPLIKYYRPFKMYKIAQVVKKIREIGRHCIQERMVAIEKGDEIPQDILSQILRIVHIDKNIDMEELIDEFITFYLAGQETTSGLLSFSFILLHQNPAILQRVLDEIQEVVGDRETVTADDIENLTFMHQVFQETLRLFPSAGATLREAPEGLELCDLHIPKGTMLMVSPYVSHRRPEVFDEPNKFNPDRFDRDYKRPGPYDYFPFGVGHRSCIGRVFAIMEAKVLLTHLFRRFSFTLPKDYKLKPIQFAELLQPDGNMECTVVSKY